MSNLAYRRVLLKLSGEALMGEEDYGIDPKVIGRLAREVMAIGGLAGAVFNAAKEAALDQFIAGRIGFLDMAGLVERVLAEMSGCHGLGNVALSLDNVLSADAEARRLAFEMTHN